jgi:cobalamin biosynthesis Mg chelatase CobN
MHYSKVVAAIAALAQTPAPQRPPSGATVTGEVKDVNPLTVTVNGQDQILQTAPNVVVNRDGKQVNLGELEEGDKVTFTTNPDNSVAQIDVTDPANAEDTVWLIVGIVALLAVVGLLAWYFLSRRRGEGRVAGGRTVVTDR